MQKIAQLSIRHWWQGVVNLVFPPTCVHCGRVGSFFCDICWEEAFTPADLTRLPPIVELDGLVALAVHNGAVRDALHALKYEGVREVAQPLAEQLAPCIQWTFDAIIPIPLHFARLAERGYNQANLLVEALAQDMNRPVLAEHLIRTKATTSQVTLGADARRANMIGAFAVSGTLPSCVLLIDDVCTTGSTLEAAALALKEAGVQTVYAATVSLAQ